MRNRHEIAQQTWSLIPAREYRPGVDATSELHTIPACLSVYIGLHRNGRASEGYYDYPLGHSPNSTPLGAGRIAIAVVAVH